MTAKDAVDNGGAGRAAKSANPVASTTEKALKLRVSELFSFLKNSEKMCLTTILAIYGNFVFFRAFVERVLL